MPPEARRFLIAGAKVALISYHPNILLKKIQNSYHFSVFGAYTYIYIYKGQQKREITKGSGGFLTARQQSNRQKSVAQYNGAATERPAKECAADLPYGEDLRHTIQYAEPTMAQIN